MKIKVTKVGRFKEVAFHDFEDEERFALSGLLDEFEAGLFADELRSVARKLDAIAVTDPGQILLPFASDRAGRAA